MHNIIEFTQLVKDALAKHDCTLEHVEQWITKEGMLYCKVKYHVGNTTRPWCKYLTEADRKVLKRGTDVHLIEELTLHLVRGNTHG